MRVSLFKSRRMWTAAAVCAFATVLAGPSAQLAQPPAPDPVGEPAQPPVAGQPPVFRSGVTLVTTDLIVRDDDGRFIPDLGPEDVVVYEDGVEQDVASLVLVRGGRVYNQLLPQAPVQEGIVLPGERLADDTAGRVFILFVDDLHLERGLTPKVRQVFKQIADTLIHEGDMFGIISSGPSALHIDMTYDRSILYGAMEKITGDGFNARELIESMQGGSNGPMELRWRVHQAFKLARQICTNLEQLEHRRKSFIYISSGYDFNPYQLSRLNMSPAGRALIGDDALDRYYGDIPHAQIRQLMNMTEPATVFADTDLANELADLAAAANRANATFYTVDPRGLVAAADISYDVPLQEWNRHLNQTQFTMRFLAELTGGTAVVNTNNFDDALEQIDAETSDYYVVGFYSSDVEASGETRRLRIEVNRPGASVRHRTHYTFEPTLN